MAATGFTPLSLYYSTTASSAPSTGNLTSGELAINITDGKLFYKDNAGAIQVIASKNAAKQQRAIAYRNESDPLFFKAQRNEATMDEWLAKVNEIKARYL